MSKTKENRGISSMKTSNDSRKRLYTRIIYVFIVTCSRHIRDKYHIRSEISLFSEEVWY